MKKSIIWIIAAILIIGGAVAAFMMISKGDKEASQRAETLPLVAYVNLDQLAEKGAFDKFITADDRSLLASMLSSGVDGKKEAKQLKDIVKNLDAMGIDTQKPVCCYLAEDFTGMVFVANISDVERADSTISLISYILEEDGEDALDLRVKNDTRTIDGEDFAVAYNDNLFALAFGGYDENLGLAKRAVKQAQVDLSMFGASDIAVSVNVDKCFSFVRMQLDDQKMMLEEMYDDGDIDFDYYRDRIESLSETEAMLDEYSNSIEPNASILFSLTFDKGRMTLAYSCDGIDLGEYDNIVKPVNMDHLAYLSKDTCAVMSMGVNGPAWSEFIRDLLTSDMLRSLDIYLSSEERMIVSIVADAIETIDGGVTIALDDLDGELVEEYDYYWDEYTVEPSLKSVDALLMADVTDSYIIANISQFAGDYMVKEDSRHYSLNWMDNDFMMGQDNGLFYVGANMTPVEKGSSALNAKWAKDIEGSVSYVVLNIDALMATEFMKMMDTYLEDDSDYMVFREVIDMFSYAYVDAKDYNSSEIVVVFDDKKTNALEQINNLVMPVIIEEALGSLY